MWRWWSYALGRKEGRDQKDADVIAVIRTTILLMYMTTNCFIIAGVIRHWNDNTPNKNRTPTPDTLLVYDVRNGSESSFQPE